MKLDRVDFNLLFCNRLADLSGHEVFLGWYEGEKWYRIKIPAPHRNGHQEGQRVYTWSEQYTWESSLLPPAGQGRKLLPSLVSGLLRDFPHRKKVKAVVGRK